MCHKINRGYFIVCTGDNNDNDDKPFTYLQSRRHNQMEVLTNRLSKTSEEAGQFGMIKIRKRLFSENPHDEDS